MRDDMEVNAARLAARSRACVPRAYFDITRRIEAPVSMDRLIAALKLGRQGGAFPFPGFILYFP